MIILTYLDRSLTSTCGVGKALGTGAFSIVKYARHITPGLTQSQWPEYAVKIIDVNKVKALEYTQSIDREITILSQL